MSWDDYKKKREEEQNDSSWDRYKQQRENPNTQTKNTELQITNIEKKEKSIWDNILGEVERIGKNIGLGAKTGVENLGNYTYTTGEHLYTKNNLLEKKKIQMNKIINSNKLNNEEKQIYLATKGDLEKRNISSNNLPLLPIMQQNNSDIDIEKIKQEEKKHVLDDVIEKDEQKINENTNNQTTTIGKKLSELAPDIGNMGAGMIASAINPAIGIEYFWGSAGGSYMRDGLERGMNEEEAIKYGTIMGAMESATEMIGVEKLSKAGKGIKTLIKGSGKEIATQSVKTGIKEVLKDYGIGIADNVMQEAIIEPIQEISAGMIAGNDKSNWDNMGQRMLQSGINGGLVSAITGGANLGIQSCNAVIEKINNGQTVTQQEYQEAVKDASKKLDVPKMVLDSVQQQIGKLNNNNISELQQESTQSQPILPTEQTILPTQENTLNQNIDTNNQQNNIQVQNKSFEDVVFDAMQNNEISEIESPLQNRNINTIGKQTKTNAYQYDNPKVKPYFQKMAQMIGKDLAYISSTDNRSIKKGRGTKLTATTKAIDMLHNEQGYSYGQIEKGLQNIIEDNGKENNAISKKIELIIDDQLRNGYKNVMGKNIFPDQEYINTINNAVNEAKTNNNSTQNLNTEQNIATTKGTSEVMNEVQNYIKNNDLDMTTDEFIEWASNVELENEENMTEQHKELYSLISDIQNRTNANNGIQYHDIVNENGKIIDKTNGKVYNINEEIIPYISVDEEKLKFIPYSQSESFYKLDVNEMEKAVALCSEDANRLYLKGKTKGSSIGENYIYEYSITGEDTFGIDKVEPIKGTTREVVNEGYFETNSTETQTDRDEQRRNNNDNKSNSRNNRRTMQEDAKVDREKSRQGLSRNERNGETNSELLKNSNKSSLSLPENVKDIKNMNEFLRKAVENETDHVWKERLKDAKSANYTRIDNRKSPLQYKREIVQQYLDYKNNNNLQYEIEDSSNNTTENEIQRKINRSMTMEQAKDMVQRAFVTGNIYDWFDGEYKNGDEWLAGVGASDVALVIDNDFNLQNKYVNANNDILNDEYTIDDVIEAYQNGTLTGSSENQTQRLDTSKDTGYKDDRFYAPKDITGGKELYNLASQRVTNKNRSEVYKARADFIINAHNEGYIESLGLNSKEVYEKLRSWTSYPKNALQTSMEINKGVSKENRWTGIENCSVVNELSVSQKQLDSLVKEIKGTSDEYQRRYISNTMLALDTHLNYKNLTFDFAPDATNMRDSVLGDYQPDYDVIRVKRDGQNTVSHEMGHYIDHLIGRELANGYNLGVTRLCRSSLDNMMNGTTFTQKQKQFLRNFANFLEDIENSSDIGSSYKMSSDEVFARFVARFTEWTRNVATGNRYGYEAKWYDDHFNQFQYKEFAKLLQEYSLLKTNNQASGRSTTLASQKTGQIQEQKIEDVFNELNKKKKQQSQIPIQETLNKASINLPVKDETHKTENLPTKGTLNPTEISNLKLEDMNTTPKLPSKNYKEGNKESSFLSNIVTDSKFLNEDLRQEMAKEENIRYYKGITNAETLEKAYNSLSENGKTETINWFSKDGKNATAEDVAKGWILLKQYQDAGDYQSAVEVAKKMRDMGTKAGQTVQAYNMMSRLTPEGMFYYAQSELNEAYNKAVEGKSQKWIEKNKDKFDLTPEETNFIKETMNEVAQMDDGYEKKVKLAEIQKLITDKIPPTSGQSIKAWMRISMLFNPKTQVRNIGGNAIILPVNVGSDVISSGIDKMIAKKTGVRTTGNINLKNYAKGFKKGLFESYNDFKKGINTRDIEGNRFEIGEGKSFNNNGVGKALNRIDNILSYMLDTGDRPFYEATFTNSINNQLILNNTNEVNQDMIDIATNEALSRTWQDNNAYTEAVLNIRKNLNKLNIKGYGLGDVLIPFAKTPANLTKAIVDYSPVGLTKALTLDAKRFNNSLNNGQYSPQLQHKFVQSLGKGMAGSLLYVLGYGLAKSGIATGEADDDKDLKNFMRNSLGINSYSLKIGDKSFTYDWVQPVAVPLSIMTNYVKYSKDNPDAKAIEKAIKSMNIGTEQLLQQSFMESLNTVLNGNGTTLENLTKSVLDLPARAIPTFSKQIADMVDSTQRTSFEYGKPVESAINSVKSKIPFVSKTLPTSRDTFGNEIQKYGGENSIWNVMFNPANVNKGKLSKVGEEIYRLYEETGETTVFPVTAPYYINNKGEKINMSAEERSEYQKVTGKYTEKAIDSLLSNSDYKKLSNEDKVKLISEIINDSNAKAKYDILDIDSKDYSKLRETLNNIEITSYYDYKLKTKDMKKDKEKIEVLINSKYNDKEKRYLYENYIKSKEKEDLISTYEAMKITGLNIDEWLKYSQQEFESDKEDDGTEKGKSISGSKTKKVYDYVNNANMKYEQRLLLLGMQYKLNNSERDALVDYVNDLKVNAQTKQKIFSKIKGVTAYKDGTIKY